MIALAVATVGCRSHSLPTPDPSARLVFDFRTPLPAREAPSHDVVAGSAEAAAESKWRALLDHACRSTSMGSILGSFTRSGAREVAFSFGAWCPSEVEGMSVWASRLVIVDADGNVLRNVETPAAWLSGKADLWGDGRQQVVLSSADGQDAKPYEAFLLDVQTDPPRAIPLGSVRRGRCVGSDGEALVSAIYAKGDRATPVLETKTFRAACRLPGVDGGPREPMHVGNFGAPGSRAIPDATAATPIVKGWPAPSSSGEDAGGSWKLLHDFRDPWQPRGNRKIAPDVERRILGVSRTVVALKGNGTPATVAFGAEGHFTKQGVTETAFVVEASTWPPRGSHVDWLVLFDENGTNSPPFEVPGSDVVRVADFDGDGLDELVMADTAGTFQGTAEAYGWLIGFRGGSLHADLLGVIDEDFCGTLREDWPHQDARVVFFARDAAGYHFRERTYEAPCFDMSAMPEGPFVEVPAIPSGDAWVP